MGSPGGAAHPVVCDPAESSLLRFPEHFSLYEPEDGSPGPTFPAGFVAGGLTVGLKGSGRLDMGTVAVCAEWREVAASAALFTENAFAAAPVALAKDECDLGHIVAVVANSGNANACTGAPGMEAARSTQIAAAEALGTAPQNVAVSSTGVIGEQIDGPKVAAGAREVVGLGTPDGGPAFARSILTTDRFAKLCAGTVSLASGSVRLGACAKGAGMIAPAMATMLCYVTTDAVLSAEECDRLLKAGVYRTFNRVTVDGEMSTNDSVFLLASGASGVRPSGEELADLQAALEAVLMRLALMMVADGEGATKIMHLRVEGADSGETAETVARAIADSPLVKTAMHGCDPNWGRIMSSAGAALAGRVAPKTGLRLCGVTVVKNAAACAVDPADREALSCGMKGPEVGITLDLGLGTASAEVFFADLGHEYVTINAEYHS